MKKYLLPLMSVMLVSASFLFTGCCTSKIEELLAEIKDIQEGGQLYKEHDKQAAKYILPNASLALSRALYLPIGGALSDYVNETVGNEYIRSYLLVQTSGFSYAKVWSAIHEKFNDDWMDMTTAERMAFLANWENMKNRLNGAASNAMTQEQFDAVVNSFSKEEKAYYDLYNEECFLIAKLDLSEPEKGGFLHAPEDIKDARTRMADQIKDIDSIPDALLKYEVINELVRIKRTQDACVFMDKDEPERLAYYETKVQDGGGSACENWLGLNDTHTESSVYYAFRERKRAAEEKISEEREKALVESVKEDAKVVAFTSYWFSVVGKVAYPIIAQKIPGTPGAILKGTTDLADIAFDGTQAMLTSLYDWLPNSLTIDVTDEYPALKAMFGTKVSIFSILSSVGALLDQAKLNTLARVANINFGDWVSIVFGSVDLLQALHYSITLANDLKNDVVEEQYGQAVVHTIGVLGNNAGLDFVRALGAELKPYQYANEIAVKRIEYTAKALEWVSGNTMEEFFCALSAE